MGATWTEVREFATHIDDLLTIVPPDIWAQLLKEHVGGKQTKIIILLFVLQ